jgi:hypothetical protein
MDINHYSGTNNLYFATKETFTPYLYHILLYSRTSNNGHRRGIQILSGIGGVR